MLAVKIRLARAGAKKAPFYRIVATDSRSPRDGRYIEILGRYNPRTAPATIEMDVEKVQAWIAKGAQPSDTVAKLLAIASDPNAKAPTKAAKPSKKAAAKAAEPKKAPAAPAPAEAAAEVPEEATVEVEAEASVEEPQAEETPAEVEAEVEVADEAPAEEAAAEAEE